MSVDPLFAQWLQAMSDNIVRSDATALGRWGATAQSTERLTGIATRAAASLEADRQLAFFARGPFVLDVHQFAATDWLQSIGLVVNVTTDDLDYLPGLDVFVIDADVDRATGVSTVTVLRPLKSTS